MPCACAQENSVQGSLPVPATVELSVVWKHQEVSQTTMACLHHGQLTLHQETTLAVNADSTEFCPLDRLQHVLAVGTYELDEKTQTRHGNLYMYYLKQASATSSGQNAGSNHIPEWQLHNVKTFPMSGIFDMKWQPVQPARLLAACADGSLHVLGVQPADEVCQVTRQQAVKLSNKGMAVSLDIADSGQQVISSSSEGSLSVLQVLA